jgi:folate-binding protein YgfZ
MSTGERSFVYIGGPDRVTFLQGILTTDVAQLNDHKVQFAALLSPQGKILNDMFLIAVDNGIVIDTQAAYAELLLKRLTMYKLRANVVIAPMAAMPELGPLPDPRHPGLAPYTAQPTRLTPVVLGIPELGRDFAPDQVVALDAGYDLLNAVSFTKGCYVGQEVTARMHYKNIARRGFYVLESDLAPSRLALLKFEDVEATAGEITVDNQLYRARLPEWMAPKLAQFIAGRENQ